MNKTQSKIIGQAITDLQDQQKAVEAVKDPKEALGEIGGKVADIRGAVEGVRDELADKLGTMSDKAKEGDKGTEMQEHHDALESAASDLEGIESELQDEACEDAIEERTTKATDALQEVIDKLGEV